MRHGRQPLLSPLDRLILEALLELLFSCLACG